MAISKRLRYEILRRDSHACRYCGRAAPDVQLHIDHVVPVILGGADEPANLVTSCADCNGGKTSSSPDAAIVDDVNASAVKWAAAMIQAAREMGDKAESRAELYGAVIDAFPSYYQDRIPNDYPATVDQFVDAGLPESVIVEMAHVAANKYGVAQYWNYFCGCCWTKVRQLQDRAMELVGGSDAPFADDPTSREAQWGLIHARVNRICDEWDRVDRNIPFSGFVCRHETEWTIASLVEGDEWICNEPCTNPCCLASYATHWARELTRITTEANRQIAVMDAADELELVDG